MYRLLLLLPFLFLSACASPEADEATSEGPIPMDIVQNEDGSYQLLRDGEPFYIYGAGLEFGDIENLAEHGANSFRTWRTDNGRDTGQEVLDRAHANGLTVTMGLEIARERPGQGRGYFNFDYDDPVAVAEQLERVRAEVMKYKDHPALIIWGIGNELNLEATNPKVWDAVNEISEMIHEIDPNHLTTTMLAGIDKELADNIKTRAPDLDLLSIQMYADIVNLPRYIEETGWDGPYMVTEWGATGHWETDTTAWGAPIENNSTLKANFYKDRYETAIASDTMQCVGSYVFLWGQKQERTPTWYGMFMPTGEETAPIDVMHEIWNGSPPDNQAPRVDGMTLGGMTATEDVTLAPGETISAEIVTSDPDGDDLRLEWFVLREATAVGHGGDDEEVPERIAGILSDTDSATPTVTAPDSSGAYRLFVNIYDTDNNAGHANIPFFVE